MAKETKDKIFRAAAELFGEKGFDNVSVRDITNRAEVNLSALSYHYTDKEGLVKAVIKFKTEKINNNRLNLLAKAKLDHGANLTLRSVLEAFIAPIFLPEIHQTDPRIVAALTSKTLIHDDENNPYKIPIFQQTVQEFLNALGVILPKHSPDDFRSILRISSGAAVSLRSYAYSIQGADNLSASAAEHTKQLHFLLDFVEAGALKVLNK